MFTFDHIVRTAAAAVCSLILTTVAIGASIDPASAGSAPTVFAAAEGGESANG